VNALDDIGRGSNAWRMKKAEGSENIMAALGKPQGDDQ